VTEAHVFVVAEAGVSNYGDPELAHRQVDAAAAAGADAVKFQTWRTPELVSRPAARAAARDLGHDWFQRMAERELPPGALEELQAHALEQGIRFFATAHDVPSLRHLVDDLGVPLLKVGSGEASNWSFLREVGRARKPVLISFGLQTDNEARRAVEILREAGAPEVTALHAVSVYPTPAPLADLGRMLRLRELLGAPVGLSDHTVGAHVALAAVGLGARVLEKHLTLDRDDSRSLDNAGALEPGEWIDFVRQVRELESALSPPPAEELASALAASRDWALPALVAARDLAAGTVLGREDLVAKRPLRGGVAASELDRVVGRTLRRPLRADEQLRAGDVSHSDR
jgi:N,N'-diacetyllegionaminate synthase